MLKASSTVFAVSGILLLAGCGDSGSNEPRKLVVDEPASPLQPAEQPAEAPQPEEPPMEAEVVRQAAHTEALQGKAGTPATVPPVLLTKQHEALCRVKVGDTLPALELPKVAGGTAKLSALYGKSATVVVFWKSDRRMARDELADLGPDVVQAFGSRGVNVVGIAVNESAANARSLVQKAAANFSQLLDADGKAFAQVGAERLPWTLVLDATGKIVWFDLEYSHATRRELQQTLLATVR